MIRLTLLTFVLLKRATVAYCNCNRIPETVKFILQYTIALSGVAIAFNFFQLGNKFPFLYCLSASLR